ncbi:flagellar basal body L-ring protein FlgH [Pseudoroseicyclus aestuarii]|uniref:Flagellar L-ring protein n=1 Tax=Pseudoroseicyclus aestuarii TaxID=1795041 RepID=A0A318SVI0_9RHOB|nr:flagellar basal body L-ring protein FlgH [Pseudoroseicyclus aestuarii]PYE84369.1 flagellar L-ring protein precursor FlgH [Pseudoroseicyclus aestuarii]
MKRIALVMAAGTLAGCASPAFNRDPSLSNLDLTPETVPEAAMIQVPMPDPEPVRIPQRAEAASLWETGSSGFFGDQRASRVGDILTIVIDIDDGASLRNATARSRQGGAGLELGSLFGYGSQIDRVLPGVGPEDLPSGNLVDLDASLTTGGLGTINRDEEINLRIAALVVRKLPNDNLVIAGRQEVKVNGELRELRVAGIIRPQDIWMDNTIAYDKIAEARIAYGGRGELSRQVTRGYGEDALDVILPF